MSGCLRPLTRRCATGSIFPVGGQASSILHAEQAKLNAAGRMADDRTRVHQLASRNSARALGLCGRWDTDPVNAVLFHFSEDPSIERFVPHVPRTNLAHPPSVWAIDERHAPLYWFPRNCPRVTVWSGDRFERSGFRETFCTLADRVHGVELGWLPAIRAASLYRYHFGASPFRPWPDASGQWISESPVEPVAIEPVGDLLDAHVEAGIELRAVPSLWPLHDLARSDRWDFSIVRMRYALPRP